MASQDEALKKRMDDIEQAAMKLQDLISNYISRSLQYMNLYFVFQVVVFSSIISSSTKITCKLKWISFTLSLLVSIFNFPAVWLSVGSSVELYQLVVLYRKDLDRLRAQQPDVAPVPEKPNRHPSKETLREMMPRKVASYLTRLLLFLFMGVMLYGCFQIECV
ncbi:hypothetical protein BT93_E1161 [Corymbia citriodora subsp. variegata]|nr:hypothetical protein BT93_E1161 [Corymbia citriodora subsp. variegata]